MTTKDNRSQIISKEELKSIVYGLEEGESVFFRRPCDLYGWGVVRKTILFQPFLFVADYKNGIVHPDALSADYQNTNDHFDIIWSRLTDVNEDETLAILIITENQAGEMNAGAESTRTSPDPRIKGDINMKKLVDAVDQLGTDGGGSIEITGTWRGKPRSIWVEQTEWHETPVCLIGGYGHEVSIIRPQDVPGLLYCVLGNYFDCETFSIIES